MPDVKKNTPEQNRQVVEFLSKQWAEANGINDVSGFIAAMEAIAGAESGWDNTAAHDEGHGYGLFALHDQGQGTGMSKEERQDAVTNTNKALSYLGPLFKSSESEGWDVALRRMTGIMGQNPADPEALYNNAISTARQIGYQGVDATLAPSAGANAPVVPGLSDARIAFLQLMSMLGVDITPYLQQEGVIPETEMTPYQQATIALQQAQLGIDQSQLQGELQIANMNNATTILAQQLAAERENRISERDLVTSLLSDMMERTSGKQLAAKDYVDTLMLAAEKAPMAGQVYRAGAEPGGAMDVLNRIAGITGEFPRQIATTQIPTEMLNQPVPTTEEEFARAGNLARQFLAQQGVGPGGKMTGTAEGAVVKAQGSVQVSPFGSYSPEQLNLLAQLQATGLAAQIGSTGLPGSTVVSGTDQDLLDWARRQVAAEIALQERGVDIDEAIARGYFPGGAPTAGMQTAEMDYKRAVEVARINAGSAQAQSAADLAAANLYAEAQKYAADQGLAGAEASAAASRYVADVGAKTAAEQLGFQKASAQATLGANPRTVFESLFLNRALKSPSSVSDLQRTIPTSVMGKGGKVVGGPAMLLTGERNPKDREWDTAEYVFAPPGTVVAKKRKGERPTIKNAMRAVFDQVGEAQVGAAVAGGDVWRKYFLNAAKSAGVRAMQGGGMMSGPTGASLMEGYTGPNIRIGGRAGLVLNRMMYRSLHPEEFQTEEQKQRQAVFQAAQLAEKRRYGAGPGGVWRPTAKPGEVSEETWADVLRTFAPPVTMRGGAASVPPTEGAAESQLSPGQMQQILAFLQGLGGRRELGRFQAGGTVNRDARAVLNRQAQWKAAGQPGQEGAATPEADTSWLTDPTKDIPTDVLPPDLLNAPAFGGGPTSILFQPRPIRGAFGETKEQLANRFNPLATNYYDLSRLSATEQQALQGLLSMLGIEPADYFEAARRATASTFGSPVSSASPLVSRRYAGSILG